MREFKPGVFNDRNYPGWENILANGGVVTDHWAFQIFINRGNRTFVEMTNRATAQILPLRWYSTLMPVDMNNDGFVDIVGLYQTKTYAGVMRHWGTTLFLNDGTGAFRIVDGMDLLVSVTTTPSDGRRWNLGAFIPTKVTPDRLEGVVYEPLGGCVAGSCSTQGLNLYKVVANGAIASGGTPPPAACTVPPAAPSNLAGAVVNGVGSVSWTPVPGATSYLVQAGSGPGTSNLFNGSVGLTVSVSAPVPAGFIGYVRVYAVNACGQSAASTEIVVR
jgi:hypothetical protein